MGRIREGGCGEEEKVRVQESGVGRVKGETKGLKKSDLNSRNAALSAALMRLQVATSVANN